MVVALVSSVSAQLNFSPGWGKRASAAGGSSSGVGDAVSALHHNVVSSSGNVVPPGASSPGDVCGPIPVSAVMHIYRLIKVRASLKTDKHKALQVIAQNSSHHSFSCY